MVRSRQARAFARAWYVLGGFAGAMAGSPLCAQDTLPRRLPPVVVTREKPRSPMDVPYAISSIRPDSLSPGQPHTMPEQTLFLLPGVTVANRTNPSQDARISIRGFGARSQFGVRSLKVLRDGMPLTLPDGQTPIDYLDLETVGRVETIRGSASSLYGNASGGVIDLRSAPPPSDRVAGQVRSWAGSNGARRNALLFGGTSGSATYAANLGRTESDGARGWSKQGLTNALMRATMNVGSTELTFTGMGLDMPVAQNPGALTRIQFDTNAAMADPQSITKKARKRVHQVQTGLQLSKPLLEGQELQAQIYTGWRTLDNPLAFSVVGIDRQSYGSSLRFTATPARSGSFHPRFTVGVDAQRLNDARKNWANCNGLAAPTASCPIINVDRGNLTLDQREIVGSIGAYGRVEAEFGPLHATMGLRSDKTKYTLTDHFTTDGRDDSGDREMHAASPMLGLVLRVRDDQSVYLNFSTAFETPTTTEMVNKPDSSAGLNPALQPQTSGTIEVGAKGLVFGVRYDFALYSTDVQDELIPFDIGSGRNAFRNVGQTRRRGAELALSGGVGPVALNGAYTYSEFTFKDFLSGTTQYAGNAIPGIPKEQLQLSAAYKHRLGFALLEWMAKDKIWVNDANAASAPAYTLVNFRLGGTAAFGKPWLQPVFGVQNVFDRQYIASVAVNAAGTVTTGKFYEPGPGRTWYVGLTAATAPW
jgi:iron complex outermembrane receptor protein